MIFLQIFTVIKNQLNSGFTDGTLKNWELTKVHKKEFIYSRYSQGYLPLK